MFPLAFSCFTAECEWDFQDHKTSENRNHNKRLQIKWTETKELMKQENCIKEMGIYFKSNNMRKESNIRCCKKEKSEN